MTNATNNLSHLAHAIREVQLARAAVDGAERGYQFRICELNCYEPYAITRQAERDHSWTVLQYRKFAMNSAQKRLVSLALEMEVSS